jgi:Ca-activated chloride channel family protein
MLRVDGAKEGIEMARRLLTLGVDGKLALRLPGGEVEAYHGPAQAWALLLIDCSSSMDGEKMSQARAGALAFAEDAMRKHYSVGLIRFATRAEVLCSLKDGFFALTSEVEKLKAQGSTNMADAINLATEELNALSGVRAIVIATDGMPDNRNSTLSAARIARDAGIDVIAIGTDDADREFLGKIASRSDLAVKVSRSELKNEITAAARLLPRAGGSS